MPVGLIYDEGLRSCPATTKLVVTLGLFNFEAALSSLILGMQHEILSDTILDQNRLASHPPDTVPCGAEYLRAFVAIPGHHGQQLEWLSFIS